MMNHDNGTLLLAASATTHHDHIWAFLDHLEMLGHSLSHCQDHILLAVRGLFVMNLLNIDHLMLRGLNVDELMIRADRRGSERLWRLHRIRPLIHLIASRRCILLLSRRLSIIKIGIIHSHS